MGSSVLRLLPLFEAAAAVEGKEEPGTAVVVITGVALVFAILVLLTVILVVEGKIFSAIDRRRPLREAKKAEKAALKAAKEAGLAQVSVQPPAAQPAAPPPPPQVEPGIPPEVVAAITAAIAAATDGAYTLRAVSTAKKGRGQWGLAGVISSTEPF